MYLDSAALRGGDSTPNSRSECRRFNLFDGRKVSAKLAGAPNKDQQVRGKLNTNPQASLFQRNISNTNKCRRVISELLIFTYF